MSQNLSNIVAFVVGVVVVVAVVIVVVVANVAAIVLCCVGGFHSHFHVKPYYLCYV